MAEGKISANLEPSFFFHDSRFRGLSPQHQILYLAFWNLAVEQRREILIGVEVNFIAKSVNISKYFSDRFASVIQKQKIFHPEPLMEFSDNGYIRVCGVRSKHKGLRSWHDDEDRALLEKFFPYIPSRQDKTRLNSKNKIKIEDKLQDYFDKHSTDDFPTDSQAMLSRRAAIFWYFWEFAIPKYTANPKDADKVIHMVTRKETFLEILNYIPWFILYETDDWLKKNRLLKTIRGLSMRIDGYHNLSRKDDKWQDAKSKMRNTVEAMKEERPKLHQYLTKLSKSLSTSGAKNSTDK